MVEGTVPRQSERSGWGELEMLRSAVASGDDVDEEALCDVGIREDCWTRVLRRSAGWRRTGVGRPGRRPAVKWNARLIVSLSKFSRKEGGYLLFLFKEEGFAMFSLCNAMAGHVQF